MDGAGGMQRSRRDDAVGRGFDALYVSQSTRTEWGEQLPVSSSQVINCVTVCRCCPFNARLLLMRWTDSTKYSRDPLSGVYSGITP